MKCIIAIDPGSSGGIACNVPNIGITAKPMPDSEDGVVEILRVIVDQCRSDRVIVEAFVERVTGYVKAARPEDERENRQPGHTMFKFGRGVGFVIGALRMAGVPVTEITPQAWQKPYSPNLKGKKRDVRKQILKRAAQRQFPQLRVTLKTADALLIYAHASALRDGELTLEPKRALSHEAPVSGNDVSHGKGDRYKKHDWAKLKREIAKVDAIRVDSSSGVGKTDALSVPVNGTEVSPGDSRKLFIGNFRGEDWVFQRIHEGSNDAMMIHKADSHDLQTLPRVLD